MGQRGPAPKPTALKLLEGNPGKRRLPRNEPKPHTGAPTRPAWLSSEAKREWARIVPELEALGLLTKVDRAALAGYCQSWANWRAAEIVVAKLGTSIGLTRTDRDGNEVVYAWQQRPEVTMSQKERQLMKLFLAEFGLTPSSRGRLAMPEKPKAINPFEEFLKRGQTG